VQLTNFTIRDAVTINLVAVSLWWVIYWKIEIDFEDTNKIGKRI
jgi:hypothetical protein